MKVMKHVVWRWWFVTLTLLVLGGSAIYIGTIAWKHPGTPCYRCNIVIVVVDSLRADALPCYGYHLDTAPHLCSFAEQNLLFTHMFANSTWTRPSNMSILTSLYPISHGLTEARPLKLSSRVTTLPQVLFRYGYDTTLVTNDQFNMGIELGFGRGFEHIQLTPASITDDTMGFWLSAIDSIKLSNKKHKPAFLFIHTDQIHNYYTGVPHPPSYFPLDPSYHSPIVLTDTFTDTTWKYAIQYITWLIQMSWGAGDIQEGENWRRTLQQAKTLEEARVVFSHLPSQLQEDVYSKLSRDYLTSHQMDAYIALSRHLYDESVRILDLSIARILERIQQDGLNDNTVVLLVSDHGELLGEHGLVGHLLSISDEEIHVPLILRIPGRAGQRIDSLVQQIDLYPTLLDVVGLPLPHAVEGISLIGQILGHTDARQNSFVISQTTIPYAMDSIQTNQWKLVEKVNSKEIKHELYDLSRDPKQERNLDQSEKSIVLNLTNLLHQTLRRQPIYPTKEQVFPEWTDIADFQRKLDAGYFFSADHTSPTGKKIH